MNEVEVGFSIMLRSGSRCDHSIFVPGNTGTEEIEQLIWDAVIGDQVWLENIRICNK